MALHITRLIDLQLVGEGDLHTVRQLAEKVFARRYGGCILYTSRDRRLIAERSTMLVGYIFGDSTLDRPGIGKQRQRERCAKHQSQKRRQTLADLAEHRYIGA